MCAFITMNQNTITLQRVRYNHADEKVVFFIIVADGLRASLRRHLVSEIYWGSLILSAAIKTHCMCSRNPSILYITPNLVSEWCPKSVFWDFLEARSMYSKAQ